MRDFLIRSAKFLALQVLVLLSLYIVGKGDKSEDQHYLSSLIDKRERLASLEKPRLIFVGGSNLMFGIDSQYIEKETDCAVVNMGVNAALGLDFILADIESKISTDDLIVLSLEYGFFLEDLAEAPSLWHALEAAPENIRALGLCKIPWMLDNGLYPIRQVARRPFVGRPEMDDLYTRENVNDWGDIAHRPERYNKRIGLPRPIKEEEVALDRAIARITLFRERAAKRGAKVVMLYPYLPESYIEDRSGLYNSVHHALSKECFMVIGKPEEASLHDKYFYDTYYHLTEEGSAIRSERVAEQLKPIVRLMTHKQP